jgi:hypothetical protein
MISSIEQSFARSLIPLINPTQPKIRAFIWEWCSNPRWKSCKIFYDSFNFRSTQSSITTHLLFSLVSTYHTKTPPSSFPLSLITGEHRGKRVSQIISVIFLCLWPYFCQLKWNNWILNSFNQSLQKKKLIFNFSYKEIFYIYTLAEKTTRL